MIFNHKASQFGLLNQEANSPSDMKIVSKHQVCDVVTYTCNRESLICVA